MRLTELMKSLDKDKKVDFVPKQFNRGTENPIRKKALEYLTSLKVGEIREIKLVSRDEAARVATTLRRYAAEITTKKFLITIRNKEEGSSIFVMIKGSDE